jgi:hypothetical protein
MYPWRADYIAALAEKDPERQRQLVYRAILAIEQRGLSLIVGEEREALEEAEKLLKILRRSMSGCLSERSAAPDRARLD